MDSRETEDLVAKGIAALENEHTHLALVCFERASEIGKNPAIGSGLGYCRAAARGQVELGLALCRESIAQEPDNVFHYRNLGSVLLLAGRNSEAIEVFRQGLRIRNDEGIIRRLDSLGTRTPPIFKSLSRKHFLNRTLGLVMSRLGFR